MRRTASRPNTTQQTRTKREPVRPAVKVPWPRTDREAKRFVDPEYAAELFACVGRPYITTEMLEKWRQAGDGPLYALRRGAVLYRMDHLEAFRDWLNLAGHACAGNA